MIQRPFLSNQSDSFHSGTQLQSQQHVSEEEGRTRTTSFNSTDLCSSLVLFIYDKSGIIINSLVH